MLLAFVGILASSSEHLDSSHSATPELLQLLNFFPDQSLVFMLARYF
jgi:hypothetical protein